MVAEGDAQFAAGVAEARDLDVGAGGAFGGDFFHAQAAAEVQGQRVERTVIIHVQRCGAHEQVGCYAVGEIKLVASDVEA